MRHQAPAPERHTSLITAMRIRDQEFQLSSGATYHYSRFQQIQVNRPKQATSLGISIKPLAISGKSTLLQVQTRPRLKKNPEKETSERRPVHAKPKGHATDKPMLMPTEASNVSQSGLTPTRENYFRPRAPLISLDIQWNAPKVLNFAGSSLSRSSTWKRLLDRVYPGEICSPPGPNTVKT
ncbi:hypothetical protein DY000_02020529 [Brassica cretica]|uniref:Uncharacterized protein n=1 Tax=Brassica cretica TaxID=69181 RepID=A0ABQ7E1L4_BRACR|nr:hypothetical protein DY000_02020529 [Brassica cretica]